MSKLLERIRWIRRFTRAQRASSSLVWARLLAQHGIDVRTSPCEPRPGGLLFPCLGTVIPGPGENVLLSGFNRAVELHARGVQFDTSCDPVRATVDSVSVRVETTEELLMLTEIYVDGTYNFDLSGSLLIVDIGMNAAYTALYLAAMHPESVVYAYEPFTPTFRCAEANIALNPILQQRIRTFQFGLSDTDRTLDIEYMARVRGSVGVYGLPAGYRISSEVKTERCEFRDAAVTLGALSEEYPNRRLVLKVDCEGSEYAILGRLADSGMLDRIDLLMIECHRRAHEHDPVALQASLTAHGFGCIHREPDAPDISMLYAVKSMGQSDIDSQAARGSV